MYARRDPNARSRYLDCGRDIVSHLCKCKWRRDQSPLEKSVRDSARQHLTGNSRINTTRSGTFLFSMRGRTSYTTYMQRYIPPTRPTESGGTRHITSGLVPSVTHEAPRQRSSTTAGVAWRTVLCLQGSGVVARSRIPTYHNWSVNDF